MAGDGFLDFGMGVGDEEVGKKAKNFKMKSATSARITFAWFSVFDPATKTWDDDAAWDADGNLKKTGVSVRFAGCPRIYIKGVGNVLASSPDFNVFGKPKDTIGTVLIVWPCNEDGELDPTRFREGRGWQVRPWIHGDGEKYQNLRKIDKRSPFMKHDVLFSCPENGEEFQKITFLAEDANLLEKLLASEKPEMRAIGDKIAAACRAMARTMKDEMAQKLTVAEVRERLKGGDGGGSSGGSSRPDKEIDNLLDDVL